MSHDPDADYLWDRAGDDPEVAGLERLLGGFAHQAPLQAPPPHRRRRPWIAAAAVATVVAVAVVVLLLVGRDPADGARLALPACAPDAAGFRFVVEGAGATCDGAPAAAAGTLPVGRWLETDATSRADLRVADIGELTLLPGSRLRLVGTGPDLHRLELARGRLTARVVAPPRLFVVDTPVATAVDLGCAYELEVDPAGRTHLRVTSGSVSLEGHGRAAWVPWGHEVVATPGRGPGTPVASDAPPALREAVARFDAGDRTIGDRNPLAIVVGSATARDAVTLWNLLARTEGADRAAVFARLDEVAIRPEWVLEEDVLSAQPQALEDWRQSLEGTWHVGP